MSREAAARTEQSKPKRTFTVVTLRCWVFQVPAPPQGPWTITFFFLLFVHMWVAAWMYVLHMCVCRGWKWVSHPGPWAIFDSDLFNALKIYSSHWSLSRAKKRMSRVSGESGLHGELQAMLDCIECDTLAQEKTKIYSSILRISCL